MSQVNRLNQGGRINRNHPIRFTYNGQQYQGFEGDTIASALLANGVDIVGRSFKYSRPRGIVGVGSEEPNAILQVGSTEATSIPNLRATQTELYDGLVCESVSGWPSAENDVMGLVGKLGGNMMPPGFYYKTFMYPESQWLTYEKYIRKAAGLGRVPQETDPDRYDKMHHHCDVLVVGGGPAGLAATLAAARTGARVILADEQSEWGGYLLNNTETLDGLPASQWVSKVIGELGSLANVNLLSRTTALGYYDHNLVALVERCTDHVGENQPGVRQRLHNVRASQVILAAGAQERPLVFGNNDRPGCMLASAVATYINRYGVVPGNKLVLMTTNDYAYQTALDWQATGREVALIVDTRANPQGELVKQAISKGIRVLTGHGVINVKGSKRVKAIEVAPLSADGHQLTGSAEQYECDTVASSGGWSPVVHLSCHTGSRPVWRDEIGGFIPGETHQAQWCVGGIQGTYSLEKALQEGVDTGLQAAVESGFGKGDQTIELPKTNEPTVEQGQLLFHIPHHQPSSRAPKQFVDYQTDVTAAAIELAAREGFESVEHVKRYTAMGFGTDQGKLGNINGMAVLAKALGKTLAETGTTIFRPSYTPTTFGALTGREVGELFDPKRYTAMHSWHEANGALFEDVGQWKRPWYYPKPGETMHEAVARECLATRNSVGVLDASTLGKIDIQGPDAREFLNRIYTNAWSKLAVGRCRYGLMLKEDGMVFDDGVNSCLGENHFLLTTTSGGAAGVLEWLENWHQTEWPELEVYFNSVTDHWATISMSGPNSRKVLEKICSDVDLSNEAFPFMSWKEATVAGVKARVFRISFTGELSFEINVQANYGHYVWEQVMAAGAEFGITPYGTETMHVLRAEKGFIVVGQDTDGSVTPFDLGMDWAVGKNKPFSFIGKRSMDRSDCIRVDRKQFVGLKPKDPNAVLPEGAQLVLNPDQPKPMAMIGHVTSSYQSACLGYSMALAVVKGGHHKMGETVFAPLADGRTIEAEICSPIFLDPKGERQNV
ncbi:sarcosine oxidase subunit alpha [Spartinivicinus ruber]|uniref:sarcosine oxidase subunit alpha n=1 Tax=Spartinivicinus ruber TaxID=2683272 RepID=UPI0013D5C8ED|nr:sarcosine oxidase subunit alpha [Spartinivicinus ruber]